MSITSSKVGVRMQSVEAVVMRADGTVENLGVVAFSHSNFFIHCAGNAGILYRRLKRSVKSRFHSNRSKTK